MKNIDQTVRRAFGVSLEKQSIKVQNVDIDIDIKNIQDKNHVIHEEEMEPILSQNIQQHKICIT